MSSASLVPETRSLTDDDAWRALRQTGEWELLRDALRRLRVADGFSHARSLAYLMSLLAIQGLIGLVGLGSLLHKGSVSHVVIATIRKLVPGSAGRLLMSASAHAHHAAGHHQYTVILGVLVSSIITATTAMGQVEQSLNRIYGVERDRPFLKKYSRALLFAIGAGTLATLAFTCLAVGKDLFLGTGLSALSTAWSVARWPLGFVLILFAITLLFRWLPRRSQPKMSWLVFGSAVATVLWGVVTIGFGLFLQHSSAFSNTYGPLTGVVALLLWCFFSNIVVLYGAAITAQLEAVRAEKSTPHDGERVARAASSVEGSRGDSPDG